MVATLEFAAKEKTRTMGLDQEDLQLKYQLIYATEQELKLAQIGLKYQREREKANANPVLLENINKQEEMEKLFVSMQESGKRTQQVFDTVFGSLTSAIDNFTKTGKLSVKDMARDIIQSLIAIQMKAAAMKFLGAAFSMFSGGGFGTGNAFGNQDLGGFLAEGGPANANTPYIVGERGPELFVPRSAGTVIPNNQMSSMASTTNVTNNYINAIDVKSFENRLLESSNTIWAGYQYANKQLASNGRRA